MLSKAMRVASAAARLSARRAFYTASGAGGAAAMQVESVYAQWRRDPTSLGPKWTEYFEAVLAGKPPPPLPASGNALRAAATEARLALAGGGSSGALHVPSAGSEGGLQNLVRAFQRRGHEAATLDPLGVHEWRDFFSSGGVPELDPRQHGFTEADLDREFPIDFPGSTGSIPLRDIVGALQRTYCGKAGFEYLHISDLRKTEWLRGRIEDPAFLPSAREKLLDVYRSLCKADTFERFLGAKFRTTKRFGCDGGEAAIAGVDAAIARAVELGVTEVVIGMPHRGRLNVLTNIVGKPLTQMFAEFKGRHYDFDQLMETMASADWAFAGDVKYHLGTSQERAFPGGRTATLTLEANPSHLETVNAVTLGRTRAKQFYSGNKEESKKRIMSVLFHGDASFTGQGVCYETMQLAQVKEYGTGGTIHVIINNQVGFTLDPADERSTMYCSDLGKAFDLPIFHCNGDDPASVTAVFELAAEWRQAWGTDVIIDLICYRRFGHNETLNPDYTQPLLYKRIAEHPRTEAVFAKQLVDQGTATKEELEAIKAGIWAQHEDAFDAADRYEGKPMEWIATKWEGFAKPIDEGSSSPTGVDVELLRDLGAKLCEVPASFRLHNGLKRQLKKKLEDVEDGTSIDWATAEALAWATLLLEGTHVRITGQDVLSGTFAHRHCVISDQKTGEQYCMLNNLRSGEQAAFIARNSILAEYGVLGFELGYTYENPHALVLWEAQFGDFMNVAQVMIDQFITAGEHKWLQQTGLVLLLPHGYEGQGAEHSSARIERFLQLCDDDEDDIPDFKSDFGRAQIQKANLQAINVTTPANLFHAFRRQQHRDFRKPLVVFTTKSLFRHKLCKSPLSELGSGSRFQRVYDERDPDIAGSPETVDRLVFCSGKVYYELVEERERLGAKNVAIVTLEQVAPFPFDRVKTILEKYSKVDVGDGVRPGNVIWCQEEPKNMGPWQYVRPRLVTTAREGLGSDVVLRYVGRRSSASPATAYAKVHVAEQAAVLKAALVGQDDGDWSLQRPSSLLGFQT